jgi:hypothetical protein
LVAPFNEDCLTGPSPTVTRKLSGVFVRFVRRFVTIGYEHTRCHPNFQTSRVSA